mgnify:FL=1
MIDKEPVLCYIDQHKRAYFTTQALSKQWGDDWNDAPYEQNARPPYDDREEPQKWKITVVAYQHPKYETPADSVGCNSGYSVEMINRKNVAWLADVWSSREDALEPIFAGTPLSQFLQIIRGTGGKAGVLE